MSLQKLQLEHAFFRISSKRMLLAPSYTFVTPAHAIFIELSKSIAFNWWCAFFAFLGTKNKFIVIWLSSFIICYQTNCTYWNWSGVIRNQGIKYDFILKSGKCALTEEIQPKKRPAIHDDKKGVNYQRNKVTFASVRNDAEKCASDLIPLSFKRKWGRIYDINKTEVVMTQWLKSIAKDITESEHNNHLLFILSNSLLNGCIAVRFCEMLQFKSFSWVSSKTA